MSANLEQVLKEIIETQGSSNPKQLYIDKDGNAVAKTPSFFNKLGSGFGGGFSKKQRLQFLSKNANAIEKIMEKWRDSGTEIWPLQNLFNQWFGKKAPNLTETIYSDWMRALPPEKKNVSISNLVLPGTHDSGAYKVDFSHPMSANKKISKVSKFVSKIPLIGPLVGSFISDWTITQESNIYNQLRQGIRVLDLRVSVDPSDNKFYISHTFCCDSLENVMTQIKKFMDEHPEEILVININPDWEHRGETSKKSAEILNLIQVKIGNLLHPAQENFDNLSMNSMTGAGKRIILNSSNSAFQGENVWKDMVSGEWFNSFDTKESLDKTDKLLDTHKNKVRGAKLNEIASNLTPQTPNVVKGILNRFIPMTPRFNLRKVEKKFNAEFIQKMKDKPLDNVQIVTSDFPDRTPIVEAVVSRNKRE